MAFSVYQVRNFIIRDTLKPLSLWDEVSENLLLGTMAVESTFGTYISQLSAGGAKSPWQIEDATYNYLAFEYLPERKPDLLRSILDICNFSRMPPASELVTNLKLACIIARVKYLTIPEKLPSDQNDVEALAKYWKKYYNTEAGAGTVEKFIEAYKKWIG
jgi:hypothetical protein